MTLKALVVAGALSAFVSTASAGLAQPAPSRDARLERFEQWLGALLHHSPGFVDDGIVVVGQQSNAELQVLFVDATTVIRILRNPNLASESAGCPDLGPERSGGTNAASGPLHATRDFQAEADCVRSWRFSGRTALRVDEAGGRSRCCSVVAVERRDGRSPGHECQLHRSSSRAHAHRRGDARPGCTERPRFVAGSAIRSDVDL